MWLNLLGKILLLSLKNYQRVDLIWVIFKVNIFMIFLNISLKKKSMNKKYKLKHKYTPSLKC